MNDKILKNGFILNINTETIALVAIALAVLVRIIYLGSREFWYDEVLSLLLSTGQRSSYTSPGDLPVVLADYTSLLSIPKESGLAEVLKTCVQLLKSLLGGEPHPPIFFSSQHLWLRLLGNSETAMRSLNALISVAAIFTTYGLGRFILGHRGGLLLAALLGVNPFYLFHSLNVRMYAPLVLWATLSALSLMHIIFGKNSQAITNRRHNLIWNVLLVISITAGLLTFYLFAYWLIALAVLVLYLDRKYWWQHALRLGGGVVLTIPWVLWGTLKQLRNADLQRFGGNTGETSAWLQHLQDVAQVLGIHLVLGDWVTSLLPITTVTAGTIAIVLLGFLSVSLLQRGEGKDLGVALILGIFPLLLACFVDIATKKFTLGFGWGRTMIIILPGCLLLLALWLEHLGGRWRAIIASVVLVFYLSISIADFNLRQRSVFHSVANLISQESSTPTLIAMNSKAWGHVMRLAYYISPKAPVMLLSEKPGNLANALETVLQNEVAKYPRLIWLDSADIVWSKLETEAEVAREKKRVEQVLSRYFQPVQTENLKGTMSLDKFTVNLYKRS